MRAAGGICFLFGKLLTSAKKRIKIIVCSEFLTPVSGYFRNTYFVTKNQLMTGDGRHYFIFAKVYCRLEYNKKVRLLIVLKTAETIHSINYYR